MYIVLFNYRTEERDLLSLAKLQRNSNYSNSLWNNVTLKIYTLQRSQATNNIQFSDSGNSRTYICTHY